MYLTYDTQSSHEGYIDTEFKEIVETRPSLYASAVNEVELFEAVINGYYAESFVPKYMTDVFDWDGNLEKARVSKRLVKRWCENVCNYGFAYKENGFKWEFKKELEK